MCNTAFTLAKTDAKHLKVYACKFDIKQFFYTSWLPCIFHDTEYVNLNSKKEWERFLKNHNLYKKKKIGSFCHAWLNSKCISIFFIRFGWEHCATSMFLVLKSSEPVTAVREWKLGRSVEKKTNTRFRKCYEQQLFNRVTNGNVPKIDAQVTFRLTVAVLGWLCRCFSLFIYWRSLEMPKSASRYLNLHAQPSSTPFCRQTIKCHVTGQNSYLNNANVRWQKLNVYRENDIKISYPIFTISFF